MTAQSLVKEYKYLIRKKYKKISEVRELKSNRFLNKCIIIKTMKKN